MGNSIRYHLCFCGHSDHFFVFKIEVAPRWKPPSLFCARIMYAKNFRSPKNHHFLWMSPLNYGPYLRISLTKHIIYSIIVVMFLAKKSIISLLWMIFFGGVANHLPSLAQLAWLSPSELSRLRLWPCTVLEKLELYLGRVADRSENGGNMNLSGPYGMTKNGMSNWGYKVISPL